MGENKVKKKGNYYFTLCLGLGLMYGIIFDSLAMGLSLGVVFGGVLANKKK